MTMRRTSSRFRVRVGPTRRTAWFAIVLALAANALLFVVVARLNEREVIPVRRDEYTVREVFRASLPPPTKVAVEPSVVDTRPRFTRPELRVLPLVESSSPPSPLAPRTPPMVHVAPARDVLASRLPLLAAGVASQPEAQGGAFAVVDGPLDLGAVDQVPRRIGGVVPAYPSWAKRRKVEGSVVARFVVATDGFVIDVEVTHVDGSVRFGPIARGAIESWRFEPAMKDGEPVAVVCEQRIVFRLAR